jgi:predicted metal-binding protein
MKYSKNINSEDFEPVVKELFDSLILMLKLHMAVEDEISEAKNDYRKQIRKIIEKAKITDPEFDQTINRWNEES